MVKVVQREVKKLLPLPAKQHHRWTFLYAQLGIGTHEESRIPNMRPYSHYACGVVSCCVVCASLAFLISLESSLTPATPCDEAVLRERVKVDWFQNIWRWISNSRQCSAPPSLLFDCGQVKAGFRLGIRGGSESKVEGLHDNDMCNSSLSTTKRCRFLFTSYTLVFPSEWPCRARIPCIMSAPDQL